MFSKTRPAPANPASLLAQADRCVKCGLCLPTCPTYRQAEDENESPRGRIALIQGLVSGALAPALTAQGHLDRCLECGACETACPSQVPVTRLVDGFKQWRLEALPAPRRWARLGLLDLAARPARLAWLLRLSERLGLRRLARASGLVRLLGLERAEALLPQDLAPDRLEVQYPSLAPRRGWVALYPGCVGRSLDQSALLAAVRVLGELGFAVSIPRDACCCGALHRHEGAVPEAERALAHSAEVYDQPRYEAVLTLASACCGELRSHPRLAGKVQELSRFLADLPWPADFPRRPLAMDRPGLRVAVHVPCSQRHRLGDPRAALDLLARVPGLEPLELADDSGCCGAAGLYMLRQPEMAQRLLASKLAGLARLAPDVLVTTNTGCALHLSAGLGAADMPIPVRHPVELLNPRSGQATGG